MKERVHFICDIYDETATREIVKWAKATFGTSKPPGVKMHEMRWWKRNLMKTNYSRYNASNGILYSSSYYIPYTRFYFKSEADMLFCQLRWSHATVAA